LARNHLERLGHVLADLRQLAAAARAGGWARNDDSLARQVGGKRCAHRLAPRSAGGIVRGILGRFGLSGGVIFCERSLEVLELQLELVDELLVPL